MSTTANLPPLARFDWTPDPRNPVLPNVPGSAYDATCCMNPFAIVRDGKYWLYYAGGDPNSQKRICLATAPVSDPGTWTRHGVVLDLGGPDSFCAHWCVLPLVHRFGNRWHLYWSGNSGKGGGLQGFPGIGLAFSDDGIHWTRHGESAIITGDQCPEFPTNKGIAGGGSILEYPQADGSIHYRMYYTIANGVSNPNRIIDQEKHAAVCHSTDGITWTDHRIVVSPRRDVPHDDIAAAAPFVWRDGAVYRMIYSAIGTRWGYYSLAQAVSHDGYTWNRGPGDSNLVLRPRTELADAWDRQMVEYPCVVREGDHLRLLYCGNGYGSTGVGTATCPLPLAAL